MNKLNYFDVHSHIQDKAFDADRDVVIARMKEKQVGALVVGTDRKMSEDAVRLAKQHENLWATVGQHPTDNALEKFDRHLYSSLAKHSKVVAIGECGLDYFHEKSAEGRVAQKELFERHIELALEVKKPLMLHCRPTPGTMDAYEDLLSILATSYQLPAISYPGLPASASPQAKPAGNIHFFAGDLPTSDQFLARGFTLSFTGVITFASQYDEIIRKIPLNRLLVETDCPYVAPVPYRGKRNEPSYIAEVVQKIADIKKLSSDEVARATTKNARRIFSVS